jgi:hypothetical protein
MVLKFIEMKLREIQYLLLLLLFLQSCGSNSVNDNKADCPLREPYEYFDQLSQNEIHFADLDYRLNDAKGKNKTDVVNSVTKEFATAQEECLKKLEATFPVGSIKLPFEQIGSKDTLIVKSAYVSGFAFPWSTATSICYYFTIEYDLIKKDLWYAKIPLTFMDSEGDVLCICNVPANPDGKSQFPIKAQPSFIKFIKIFIN